MMLIFVFKKNGAFSKKLHFCGQFWTGTLNFQKKKNRHILHEKGKYIRHSLKKYPKIAPKFIKKQKQMLTFYDNPGEIHILNELV